MLCRVVSCRVVLHLCLCLARHLAVDRTRMLTRAVFACFLLSLSPRASPPILDPRTQCQCHNCLYHPVSRLPTGYFRRHSSSKLGAQAPYGASEIMYACVVRRMSAVCKGTFLADSSVLVGVTAFSALPCSSFQPCIHLVRTRIVSERPSPFSILIYSRALTVIRRKARADVFVQQIATGMRRTNDGT